MNKKTQEDLRRKAFEIRRDIITTIVQNGEGHAGPALSCADILSVVFFYAMDRAAEPPERRDRFILSAGHKCLALYGALAEAGLMDRELLRTYNKLGTPLPGHPDAHKLNCVDFSTGSLGHGLGIACGVCKGMKMLGSSARVYVVMGDGEQTEGSVWEAATFARQYGLNNLIAFVDRNGLQVRGKTEMVMDTAPLEERYRACGWKVITADGHDMAALCAAVDEAKQSRDLPTVIICDTIKAKGLPFAEGDYRYHHWDPTEAEKELALKYLQETAQREGWAT